MVNKVTLVGFEGAIAPNAPPPESALVRENPFNRQH